MWNKSLNAKKISEGSYLKIDLFYLFFVSTVFILLSAKGLNTSLWLDEAWRVNLSQQKIYFFSSMDYDTLRRIFSFDGLLRLYETYIGKDEWHYRIMSMIFGLLAVVVTFFVGRKFLNRSAAYFGSSLTAVNSLFLYQSAESSVYTLTTLICLIVLFIALEDNKSGRSIFVSACLIFWLVFLHFFYSALAFFTVTVAYFLRGAGAKKRKFNPLIILFAGLSVTLLTFVIWHQFILAFLETRGLNFIAVLIMAERLVSSVFSVNLYINSNYLPSNLILYMPIVVFIILSLANFRKNISLFFVQNRCWLIMAITSSLYCIFLLIQSAISGATYSRYFLGALPIVYLSIGYCFSKVRIRQRFILNVIVPLTFVFGWHSENIFDKARPDAREASKVVEDMCKQENIKVFVPETFETPLYDYYFSRSGVCELVKSPSFARFFVDSNTVDLFPSPEGLKQQDDWLRDQLVDLEGFVLVGERSIGRIEALLGSISNMSYVHERVDIGNIGIFRVKRI